MGTRKNWDLQLRTWCLVFVMKKRIEMIKLQKERFSGRVFSRFPGAVRVPMYFICMVLTILFLLPAAYSQDFTGGFTFYIPPFEPLNDTWFPDFQSDPIDDGDFVGTDLGGDFIVNGQRVRFYGVSLNAGSCFPDTSLAPLIAQRFQDLGYNIVRLHQMDNFWHYTDTIFDTEQGTRVLNPEQLDRLERLIYEFKLRGIRIIIGLNVLRDYQVEDGIPDADSLRIRAEGISQIDPYLIFLQKEYAENLLTHVSPYTGLPLANDPVLALLEINNENSLYYLWRKGRDIAIDQGGTLTWRHYWMLDSLWDQHLQEEYGSTEALRIAWQPENTFLDNYTLNPSFEDADLAAEWTFRTYGESVVSLNSDQSTAVSGDRSAHLSIEYPGTDRWHIELSQFNHSIYRDSIYTVSFYVKSDQSRGLEFQLWRQTEPWYPFFRKVLEISDEWQKFTFQYFCRETSVGDVKIAFLCGADTGDVWIDDVYFGPVKEDGLQPDEDLETRNVRRIPFLDCPMYSDNRVMDITRFYVDHTVSFFREMRRFLREDLGVRIPVEGTNWVTSLPELYAESSMDYMDTHTYWDHSWDRGSIEDGTYYRYIENHPHVEQPGAWGDPVAEFGYMRVRGMPHVIGETNSSFPNRYQVEDMLIGPSYAAFHDVDALLFFNYNGNRSWFRDMISDPFTIQRNTGMMAFMPTAGLAFRREYVAPAHTIMPIRYRQEDVFLWPKYPDVQGKKGSYDPLIAYLHSMEIETFDDDEYTDTEFQEHPMSPFYSDTGELMLSTDGLFTVVTPEFVGTTGFLQRFGEIPLGPLTVNHADDHLAFSWISLTGEPLEESGKSLMTLAAMTQNSGMIWHGEHTLMNDWGHEPTVNKRVRLDLTLNVYTDSLFIYPLDPMGNPQENEVMRYCSDLEGKVRFSLDQWQRPTVWFGVELYPLTVEQFRNSIQTTFNVGKNYPNPFNAFTIIPFTVRGYGPYTIRLFNVLGEEVYSRAGEYRVGINNFLIRSDQLASGTYYFRLETPGNTVYRKLMLVK